MDKKNVPKDNAKNELHSLFRHDRASFARKVTKEILQGLDFIHSRGVCMRYFDPERLIITDDGVVKLSFKDFLLYDILYNIHSDGLTSGLGTFIRSFPVSYCSPEMILIDARIDNRSDIYSVGILLFQMLTGHTPYKGQFHEIMSQQLKGKMPLNEIEDKQFRKIIKKATEKDPANRFQSAIEFINAIDKMDENVVWYKKLYSFFGSFRKKNRLDCIIISILVTIFFCSKTDAQNTMRINYKDGSISEVPIGRIDSITFVEKNEEAHEVPLFGEWFWGSNEKGYYEVLSFNEDRTYTGYDYYLDYGYDTWMPPSGEIQSAASDKISHSRVCYTNFAAKVIIFFLNSILLTQIFVPYARFCPRLRPLPLNLPSSCRTSWQPGADSR